MFQQDQYIRLGHPNKMFHFPSPSTQKVGSVGQIKKKLKNNLIFFIFTEISKNMGRYVFSLNGTLKKVGQLGNGKRNNLLGWPYKALACPFCCEWTANFEQ